MRYPHIVQNIYHTPIKRYIDGAHYCTKRDWFEKNPEDFPAPFHKTFHFEMSLEAATDGGKDDASLPVVPPEMLVDYVRISQVW